ncbi:hypothetical protein HYC85_018267 [Camellia sinensis]|uniref:Uncharacterized protein n=1 Tax=Camellia sinensis TaxID=4442 RepID=A0A7J7GU54_CAMSI|nr:hypothetical protein HYC85_018267 [Camellia sinensis]
MTKPVVVVKNAIGSITSHENSQNFCHRESAIACLCHIGWPVCIAALWHPQGTEAMFADLGHFIALSIRTVGEDTERWCHNVVEDTGWRCQTDVEDSLWGHVGPL